jgi:Skp family chaperone for outer membrane proteins
MRINGWIALTVLAGLAAVAALGLAQTRPGAAGGAPRLATRVAVCDVAAVFNKYDKATDLTDRFNARRDKIKAEDDARGKEISDLEAKLKPLQEGSAIFEETFAKLQKLDVDRQAWRKTQESTVVREHRMLTEQMYEEIAKVIADLAKEQGFDLVIYRDNVDLASQTTSELLAKIAQRKVLYNDPSLDLTQAVLERANAAYKAAKK